MARKSRSGEEGIRLLAQLIVDELVKAEREARGRSGPPATVIKSDPDYTGSVPEGAITVPIPEVLFPSE